MDPVPPASPPQQGPKARGVIYCLHLQSGGGQEKAKAAGCSEGVQTQASFSGASASANTGPREAWEPQSRRGLGDVGNAGEGYFASEFTRLAHSVLVKSSGKPEFFLSCHPLSQGAGSLLPVGTG